MVDAIERVVPQASHFEGQGALAERVQRAVEHKARLFKDAHAKIRAAKDELESAEGECKRRGEEVSRERSKREEVERYASQLEEAVERLARFAPPSVHPLSSSLL